MSGSHRAGGPVTGPPTGGPAPQRTPEADRSVGELAFDVTERVSILVREEIALAKVEVTEKATELGKGAAVGIAAGIFGLVAFAMLLHAIAWGINDILGIQGSIWVGFLIEAFVWLIVAAIAGLLAYKFVQKGAPPKPTMAIEEMQETKAMFGSSD